MHISSVEAFTANFTIIRTPAVNLSCKSNKLFLYEKKIGLKWDMVQFSWVKIFKQQKGFTLSVPKGVGKGIRSN